MIDRNQKLHNNLAILRKEKGFTQASLADACGVSRKTINTVENQIFIPSTVLALKMAAALECAVEDIFTLKNIS